MNSTNDLENLRSMFPAIERGIIQDFYENCGRNYQLTYHNLCSIFGSSPPPLRPARNRRPAPLSDREQIQQWSDPQFSNARFQRITEQIAIVSELMGSSRMDKNIAFLEEIIHSRPLDESIHATAANFVATAFNLKSSRTSETFVGSDPGGITSRGNFYDGFISLYNSLPEWQHRLFHVALREMCQQSDIDRDHLQLTCGLILRGSRECNARKQEVFFNVIQHSISRENHSNGRANTSGDSMTNGEQTEQHKMKLFDAAMEPIDELKDCAFRAVFLEPTKMYFRAVGDHTMEGDVEVHGSNTYLTILLLCLGIKLSRSPLLCDEAKGIAQIKEGLKTKDLTKLWDPKNKGARWETFLRGQHPSIKRRVNHNRFYAEGRRAKDVAINCDDKSVEPYLIAYAKFFEHNQVIHRLCNYFLSKDHLHPHLNAIFIQLATEEEIEESNGEAKYWLWDVMTGEFRKDRGLQLLHYAGILKDLRNKTG